MRERFSGLYRVFSNKWYFDELIDALVTRPVQGLGRFADRTFEPHIVDGLVNLASGTVRGLGAGVRGLQSGFLRSYTLFFLVGLLALGVYFLSVAS